MDEVINYIMETPGNTNPNVLRGMLQNSSSSGDGGNVLAVEIEQDIENQKFVLNKTYKEIFDADGVYIFSIFHTEDSIIKSIFRLVSMEEQRQKNGSLVYLITCYDESENVSMEFRTYSENDYPEFPISMELSE